MLSFDGWVDRNHEYRAGLDRRVEGENDQNGGLLGFDNRRYVMNHGGNCGRSDYQRHERDCAGDYHGVDNY